MNRKTKSSAAAVTLIGVASAAPEPDHDEALRLVMQLMAIPGLSGDEAAVAAFITERLREAGAPAAAIRTDRANQRTPLKGNTGNLIVRLPGTIRGARRLLMAHVGRGPGCRGSLSVP